MNGTIFCDVKPILAVINEIDVSCNRYPYLNFLFIKKEGKRCYNRGIAAGSIRYSGHPH